MNAAILIVLAAMPTADGPAPKTTYYLGESKVMLADGRPIGNGVMLVKRELIPAESKIVETVLSLSSRPGEAPKEFVAVLAVKGNRFTTKEEAGAFSGEGELIGKPWEWTGWNSTSKLTGSYPGTVKSVDKIGGRGLVAAKEFYGPDGDLRVKFEEDYATIDGATFDLLRSKLLPKDKGPSK